jgi:hypothetical protein
MLTILVGGTESFDETKQEFVTVGGFELQLEHSLVSLSKWESKFEKPFLGPEKKTDEEAISYIEAMILTQDFSPELLKKLNQKNFDEINAYIDAKMTATWFSDSPGSPKTSEVITSELIYFWLITFQIPWEAQHWHLNRLFTLIKVINAKSAKPKKMSRSEIIAHNRELNARRRAQTGSKG